MIYLYYNDKGSTAFTLFFSSSYINQTIETGGGGGIGTLYPSEMT